MGTKIKTFDMFINSLKDLESKDPEICTWQNNRICLAFRLALYLDQIFREKNSDYVTDMCPTLSKSKKSINPDIIVHNRKTGKNVLAIVCRNEYLSESEQKRLRVLGQISKAELTMAISFFPNKNYMLLYRSAEEGIEYYHFDRNTLTSKTVRKKTAPFETVSDSSQLLLLN